MKGLLTGPDLPPLGVTVVPGIGQGIVRAAIEARLLKLKKEQRLVMSYDSVANDGAFLIKLRPT